MVPEAQPSPSPSPSPPPPADAGHTDPPVAPMQQPAGDGCSAEATPTPPLPPPHSTAIVVSNANAAKYVPPRAADRTAHPGGDARSWYSWNGGRTKDRHRAPPPPPPRPQPQPRASLREPKPRPQLQPQPRAEPPPRAAVPPVSVPAPAPAPIPTRSAERDILSRKRRRAALQRTALVARVAAAGLCLAALLVLAADSRKGWALDSYSNYTQLRYSEAVNVIGFLYSVFQFFALAAFLRRNRHLIPRPKGDYFDFTMDQVLAYLLISSSSSATARVGDWTDNWGSDPFPKIANSSIAISFLAFMVFAINSLISAYNLFRQNL